MRFGAFECLFKHRGFGKLLPFQKVDRAPVEKRFRDFGIQAVPGM